MSLSRKKKELLPFKQKIGAMMNSSMLEVVEKKKDTFAYREMKLYNYCINKYLLLCEELLDDVQFV